jgi:hypothetical protein
MHLVEDSGRWPSNVWLIDSHERYRSNFDQPVDSPEEDFVPPVSQLEAAESILEVQAAVAARPNLRLVWDADAQAANKPNRFTQAVKFLGRAAKHAFVDGTSRTSW